MSTPMMRPPPHRRIRRDGSPVAGQASPSNASRRLRHFVAENMNHEGDRELALFY
jgi:hypothetical protein